MKRTFALVIAVLVVLSSAPLFAAGARQAAGTQDAPLVWYVPGGGGYPYDAREEQMVYDAFNELLERDLGLTVNIVVQGGFGDYNERMPLILASGEYMDLLWTATWSNNFIQNAYDGFYAGLDELLELYGQDILKDTRDQLEATRINGEIRAVWSQQIAVYRSVFSARTDLAEKYGWDLASVRSMRDLEPFLRDVRAGEPNLVPLAQPSFAWVHPYHDITGLGVLGSVVGVRVYDDPIRVINFTETPEYRAYIDLVWNWQNEGYIPEDGVTYTRDHWTQIVNQGRNAFGMHNTYNPQLAEREVGGYWVKTYPIGEGQTITENIINTLMAVHSQSNRKEDSVKLLNWLWTNSEGYNTLVWGVEGRHYERLEPNRIRPLQDSGYWTNLPWMWGNTFIGYLLPGQPESLFEDIARLNREAYPANVLGFTPDMSEIRTLVASISAVVDQYDIPLSGGWVDPATGLPEFQAALNRAGLPQLITALQAQVDAWVAENR